MQGLPHSTADMLSEWLLLTAYASVEHRLTVAGMTV